MNIHVVIPAMDEMDYLPKTLKSLAGQTDSRFDVTICVNQPDEWWSIPEKRTVCEANRELLAYLAGGTPVPVMVIDRSSPGAGWNPDKGGVGRARKELFDHASDNGRNGDIVVSLDGDTELDPGYIAGVRSIFMRFPEITGLAAPYYHCLSGDGEVDRRLLRYECYLRHFATHLWRVGSPYCFTALGSALAFPVWAYRKAGVMKTRTAGEDFYLLQKLVKLGRVLHWLENSAGVYPAARRSYRVPVGTGPALGMPLGELSRRYPIVEKERFDQVGTTLGMFPRLFRDDVRTPLDGFLKEMFRRQDPWAPLRRNNKTEVGFVRACHERLDGLRTFQYLRSKADMKGSEEERLVCAFRAHSSDVLEGLTTCDVSDTDRLSWEGDDGWSFNTSPIEVLDSVRNCLRTIENRYRRADLKRYGESKR